MEFYSKHLASEKDNLLHYVGSNVYSSLRLHKARLNIYIYVPLLFELTQTNLGIVFNIGVV